MAEQAEKYIKEKLDYAEQEIYKRWKADFDGTHWQKYHAFLTAIDVLRNSIQYDIMEAENERAMQPDRVKNLVDELEGGSNG